MQLNRKCRGTENVVDWMGARTRLWPAVSVDLQQVVVGASVVLLAALGGAVLRGAALGGAILRGTASVLQIQVSRYALGLSSRCICACVCACVRVCMRACVHFCMYSVPVALQDQLEAQTRPLLSSAALSPRPPSPCRYSWKRGMLGGAQYPSPLSLISLSFSTASCKAPSIPPVVFRPLGAVVGGGGGGHGGRLGSHGGLLLDNLRLLHLEQGSDEIRTRSNRMPLKNHLITE